jgi:predicted RNA-binding protein (virulence factor B family)
MAASSETVETDFVKNALTAVVIFVREDNDVALTTDQHGQHVVMGHEQNVVDPLRNLNDPAMWKKNERFYIVYTAAY